MAKSVKSKPTKMKPICTKTIVEILDNVYKTKKPMLNFKQSSENENASVYSLFLHKQTNVVSTVNKYLLNFIS